MRYNKNMLEKDIPDYNIFMICKKLNKEAFRDNLPKGYCVRNCRKDEYNIWKKFPFDNENQAREYDAFMEDYFEEHYKAKETLFFNTCKFICDENDKPITTAFVWKYRDKYTIVSWLKTLKECESKGLGRVILTHILKNVNEKDYPIYLHTQPGSFRAIKLYSDFGFKLIRSPEIIDSRKNELKESLPILKEFMIENEYNNLKFCDLENE